MKPITPGEVAKIAVKAIPDQVIHIFNDLIARNWNGSSATILQKEVVAEIVMAMDCSRSVVFDNHWLDVEDLFREAGWDVDYDKPAYCESYEASFKFTKKKDR